MRRRERLLGLESRSRGRGSLEDPEILYSRSVPGVAIGHSASFSWDGEVLVFGHEPGGGGQAQSQATTPEVKRTMFSFEPTTGAELGRHVLPRPQTSTENCTIHNYNVVPTAKGRVLVHGSYQSGIGVVDFTDPGNGERLHTPTQRRSRRPASSWAVTGRATGTTVSSTSPTSGEVSSTGG